MLKQCTPLWCEAHVEVKMYSGPLLEVEMLKKVHAVVARSTFRSQNVQNTTCSRHFLEVQISKKCTLLRRETHFEVKMYKTLGVRTTFGGSDVASLRFRVITLHYTLHYTTVHYTTLHSTTLLHTATLNYTTLQLHYTRKIDR